VDEIDALVLLHLEDLDPLDLGRAGLVVLLEQAVTHRRQPMHRERSRP
jgi:hypothetical protein